MRRRHISLISAFLILAALVGGLGWTIYAPVRQERFNRALIAAIKRNDTKTALALLADGADPDSRDEPPQHLSLWRLIWDRLRGKRPASAMGPTALWLACDWGDGAEGENGGEPADSWDNWRLVQALLVRGAKVNVRGKEMWETPLILAARLDKAQVCQLLIVEGGANVNAVVPGRGSALFFAIIYDRVRSARTLIQHGANVNLKTREGYTPLKLAEMMGSTKVMKMLQQAGAKE